MVHNCNPSDVGRWVGALGSEASPGKKFETLSEKYPKSKKGWRCGSSDKHLASPKP
jgi:hypothetical protein